MGNGDVELDIFVHVDPDHLHLVALPGVLGLGGVCSPQGHGSLAAKGVDDDWLLSLGRLLAVQLGLSPLNDILFLAALLFTQPRVCIG